jgi:uncharacterized repeat protein (TIGR01451 family)
MEKTVRDAYQIMMNRADYYESYILGGTKYIKFRSNPDCTEGTGYAMLAAAMMADKTTFDGLWLFTHDFAMNKVTRYIDGSNPPAYNYSTLPGWANKAGGNSAADGDFDIAMALLIAHKQWGDLMGINDSRGNPISYKDDVIKVLKGLSDTLTFAANGRLLSGDIGLDGYFKSGDSWGELTKWAESSQNLASIGIEKSVVMPSGDKQHIDYTAPAYFRQFAEFLRQEDSELYAWNIFQFERAEASSDWLMGKHHRQNSKNIPVAGWVEITNDTMPAFTTFSDSEDFRAPWRTVLNYVWHGNPSYTWNPVTHTVTDSKPNTFLKDAGERFSDFLWDRRQPPWDKSCENIIGEGQWWGPSMLKYYYSPQGDQLAVYPLNWMHGTGSPSAVTAQDFDLMAEMYRHSELEWDIESVGDRYLTSTPHYFHGFFRLLGMMTLTGNHHAPSNMEAGANMKVYLDVDKTYAFEGDTITYTIDYRNYGARDGQNVVITSRLHDDMKVISAAGGGTYDPGTNSVQWNIGTVSGFKTAAGVNPTKGTVSFKAVVSSASLKRYNNSVEITCSNGSGWVSNEYPNKISSVMKRNGVDIVRRGLWIAQSVSNKAVNPGMTATYTIDFENSTGAGQLSGGRPGVNFSYAHSGTQASDGSHTFMIRAFHDAHEAYIDYGNYRISYFTYDENYTGIGGTVGWNASAEIASPASLQSGISNGLRHESVTPGENGNGKWNQRLIMQLADVESSTRTDTNWATMAAPTQFLINYYGLGNQRVHRGAAEPLKVIWRMHANYANRNWGGDWSFNPQAQGSITSDAMASWGYPVSPDFTESSDPDYQGKPVKMLHRKLCGAEAAFTVDNILIEEWDGYAWRRVFGSAPQAGREVSNVVIVDTLPQGVTFQDFIEPFPLGIAPEYNADTRVISWKAGKMPAGKGGKIRYNIKAGDTPAEHTDLNITSRAWMSADDEQTAGSGANFVVTNNAVSVLETERVVPQNSVDEPVIRSSEAALTEQFSAGPNPVSKSNGAINFFRSGKRVKNSTLYVYDAAGNVVNKLKISDKTQSDNRQNRPVGSWDLKDMKKRPVSEGTYLVKGVLTAADGRKEKISMILGVVK